MKFKITKIEKKIFKNSFGSTKNISFSKLDKMISTNTKTLLNSSNTKKLNNNNVRRIFDKTNFRIKTYHLEYIEQETLEKIPNYVYNQSANIHIQPILDGQCKTKNKTFLFKDGNN
jgi:hypothetical protein